uniref:Ig-like domain-containing protein n=1 Tax=Ornithorhynchus anatinus TaxID=9258 RepID=A0A6I8PCR6_ORNAN
MIFLESAELTSVLCVCHFFLTGASGQDKVEQTPSSLSIREGGTMNCSYKTSNFYGLQWYRQVAGKGLEFLFLFSSKDQKESGRLLAELKTESTISFLHIKDAQVGDSATYFCALDAQ